MNATAKPTTYPPVFALIPKELTACSNWVMWKYEQRDDRWTKVPYTPAGALASSTEPATWSAFDVAKAAYRPEVFDGVGFMLGGSGFVGIDLDHVLDDVHLDDEAGRIIDAINSYTEVSPSTQGIRIIARGTLPDGWRSTKKYKVAGWAPVSEAARAAGGEPIWEMMARYLREQKIVRPRQLNAPRLVGVTGNPGMAPGA